eukprot:4062610-Pleurochrysis_carterae.AAC.3
MDHASRLLHRPQLHDHKLQNLGLGPVRTIYNKQQFAALSPAPVPILVDSRGLSAIKSTHMVGARPQNAVPTLRAKLPNCSLPKSDAYNPVDIRLRDIISMQAVSKPAPSFRTKRSLGAHCLIH